MGLNCPHCPFVATGLTETMVGIRMALHLTREHDDLTVSEMKQAIRDS